MGLPYMPIYIDPSKHPNVGIYDIWHTWSVWVRSLRFNVVSFLTRGSDGKAPYSDWDALG